MSETQRINRLSSIMASKRKVIFFSSVGVGIPWAVGMLWLTWEYLPPPLVAFVVVIGLIWGYFWSLAMWLFFIERRARKLVSHSDSHGEQL